MSIRTQKTVKQFQADFTLADSQLTIELRSPTEEYTLTTVLSNDKLPSSFINIFDTVADFYSFIKESTTPGSFDLAGNTFKLLVKTAGRLREVCIELTRTQISRQEILERRVEKLEKNQQSTSNTSLTAQFQKETQRILDDFVKKQVKPLAEELKKLTERVVAIESRYRPPPNTIFNPLAGDAFRSRLYSEMNAPKLPKKIPSQEIQKLPSDPVEIKQGETNGVAQVNGERSSAPIERIEGDNTSGQARKVKDFIFDIDLNNKYFSDYFIVTNNTVTRMVENEEIYMFSSSNPIPSTDRYCLRIRINKISEGLIWVGLLNEAKKQEQYIGEEPGIMQFSLEGNKMLIDGKSYSISVPEFKDGQVLSMEVEIPTRKLRFYRNEKPNPLVKITIPESLAAGKLFPYVQLINEGDSITFL